MTTGTKPYLLRALYERCVDNGQTPCITAQVNEYMHVPTQYVHENEIVLNIGLITSHNLNIDDEWTNFSARFNGMAHDIWAPVGHVVSVLTRKNGEGMGFEVKPYQPENTPTQEQIPRFKSKDTENAKPREGLELVKQTEKAIRE